MNPWLLDVMSTESAASAVRPQAPALVPLLPRTPACAIAADTALRPELDEKACRRQADLLADRQKRLRAQQPRARAVLPVSALRCRVGEPGVMDEQLQALQEAAELRDVTGAQLHGENARRRTR
ncbi:DUF5753 domain-containing protein [Streptomyces sp. OUCMDZ-4982]|uniref:DUF5753 domain-containing protein n=1 Tax=Streptomyces sp. OUCMDZ-4982 TaxID=2973090 RepID=UPI00215D164E|nr:DUF5753 domain-containing protein [Streptomyces sp. OUCMDZ-4982]MCR8945580.1 DUF5753 domain-containing protein [Streptomyces sp. OUCMDZ-4982]